MTKSICDAPINYARKHSLDCYESNSTINPSPDQIKQRLETITEQVTLMTELFQKYWPNLKVPNVALANDGEYLREKTSPAWYRRNKSEICFVRPSYNCLKTVCHEFGHHIGHYLNDLLLDKWIAEKGKLNLEKKHYLLSEDFAERIKAVLSADDVEKSVTDFVETISKEIKLEGN